jgi:ML domain
LEPDTPAPGDTVSFAIKGEADLEVDTGSLDISVAYMGMDIFAESEVCFFLNNKNSALFRAAPCNALLTDWDTTFVTQCSTQDLCDKTACPIQKGPVVIAYNQYLPPIVPPGEYTVTIHARSTEGEELLCLVVDFEVDFPSTAAAASTVTGGLADKAKHFLHHS